MVPESATQSARNRLSTLSSALPYVAGSLLVLAGFVVLYLDAVAGILLVVGGAWLAPAIRSLTLGRVPVDVPASVNVLLALLVAGSGVYVVATAPNEPSESFESFQSILEEEGVPTERVAAEGDQWVVETSIPVNDSQTEHRRLQSVALMYAGAVPDERSQPNHEGLELVLRSPDGGVITVYTIDADLARSVSGETISLDSYLSNVEESNSTS